MKLSSIARIAGAVPTVGSDPEIAGLAYDSRLVREGDLFICRQGHLADGHEFAGQAVAAGASALIVERFMDLGVPELVVPDAGAAMNRLASPFYGDPSRRMAMAGITGTNGKTTVAFMLESVFRAAGDPAGMMGTVETRVAGTSFPATRTTPESVDIQRTLAAMVDAGVGRCAMEVTSIGIDAGRVEGVQFAVAAFTNLTHDHLDHHKTMNAYFDSKLRLFSDCRPDAAVINIDDPYGKHLVALVEVPVTTFGLSQKAKIQAKELRFSAEGARFVAIGEDFEQPMRVALSGRFNVSNTLAALGCSLELGIAPEVVAEGIAALEFVPGRMEPVREGQDFAVFVDYAHTPDGLENVLKAAGEVGSRRVIAVMGCGGDRDRAKRPLMGEAAARLADVVIVTSDNPRSEDPLKILDEIEEGILPGPPSGGYEKIEDRREAIRRALALAGEGDVVVIAGKGHESGQEKGGVVTPFDDRKVAAELLREMR